MKNKSWLKNKIKKYQNTEEYIIEKQILEITEQISIRLKELKWTKKDLAKKMNVSQAFITKLLNGNNNYTLKTLFKLSKLLDLELNVNFCKVEDEVPIWYRQATIENVGNSPWISKGQAFIWHVDVQEKEMYGHIMIESNIKSPNTINKFSELN